MNPILALEPFHFLMAALKENLQNLPQEASQAEPENPLTLLALITRDYAVHFLVAAFFYYYTTSLYYITTLPKEEYDIAYFLP